VGNGGGRRERQREQWRIKRRRRRDLGASNGGSIARGGAAAASSRPYVWRHGRRLGGGHDVRSTGGMGMSFHYLASYYRALRCGVLPRLVRFTSISLRNAHSFVTRTPFCLSPRLAAPSAALSRTCDLLVPYLRLRITRPVIGYAAHLRTVFYHHCCTHAAWICGYLHACSPAACLRALLRR